MTLCMLKTPLVTAVACLLALGAAGCDDPRSPAATEPAASPTPAASEPLGAATRTLARDVIAWTPGTPVTTTPEIDVSFTYLVTWLSDDAPPVLSVASWDQTSDGFKAFVGGMIEGSTAASAQGFYEDFFHRYFVAHEAARFAERERGLESGAPYDRHSRANEQAVAYWLTQPGGAAWLEQMFSVVRTAKGNLPAPPEPDVVAFYNADPAAVRADGALYGWYLMHLALEAWDRRAPRPTSAPTA